MYHHHSSKCGKQTESVMLCEFCGNADDIYVPPHRIELFKRMPLISFATAWNSVDDHKYNQNQKSFLKKRS